MNQIKIFQKLSVFLSKPKGVGANFRRFFSKKTSKDAANEFSNHGFQVPKYYGLRTTLALVGVSILLFTKDFKLRCLIFIYVFIVHNFLLYRL